MGLGFRGMKSPCGNGGTHSLGFPYKVCVCSYGKTLGRVLGGINSPCENGDTHSLGFHFKNTVFSYVKTPGLVFGGIKKPLREWPHALPGFGQVPVSNPGLEPGASGVRRPRASPLGNLTTVGHLAKVSLDLGLHFQTQKTVS